MNGEEAKTLLQQAVFGACEEVFAKLLHDGLVNGTPEELAGKVSAFAVQLLASRWAGEGSTVVVYDVAPVELCTSYLAAATGFYAKGAGGLFCG